jgi:hypothetical protein
MSHQKSARNATAVAPTPSKQQTSRPPPSKSRTRTHELGRNGTPHLTSPPSAQNHALRIGPKDWSGGKTPDVATGGAAASASKEKGKLRRGGALIRIVKADPIPWKFRDLAVVTIEEYGEIMRLGRSKAYEDVKKRPELVLNLSNVPRIPVARLRRLLLGEA